MARFTVAFETDNAAFDENYREVADILKDIGKKVVDGYTEGRVFDSYGNSVGRWEWEQDESTDE